MTQWQSPSLPGFEILDLLGVGGMSMVWKARERSSGKTFAVKVLNPEFTQNEEDVNQFCLEEHTMAAINHPGVVKSFRLENANGLWYFVMEYVDGYNFGQLLARKQHLRESDCLLICESVATALDYAWNEHAIVHCDLKPENLMINSDGVIKITDLGLCHEFQLRVDRHDAAEHVLGTPAYISPEQVFGDVELDCRSDIYSLAATLYHLATGRVLFPGIDAEAQMRAHCEPTAQAKDPRLYRPALTPGFSQLLEAMLVKERKDRIATWSDVYQLAVEVENGVAFASRESDSPSSIRLQ